MKSREKWAPIWNSFVHYIPIFSSRFPSAHSHMLIKIQNLTTVVLFQFRLSVTLSPSLSLFISISLSFCLPPPSMCLFPVHIEMCDSDTNKKLRWNKKKKLKKRTFLHRGGAQFKSDKVCTFRYNLFFLLFVLLVIHMRVLVLFAFFVSRTVLKFVWREKKPTKQKSFFSGKMVLQLTAPPPPPKSKVHFFFSFFCSIFSLRWLSF